jgi:Fe-S-cluster containining protein
VDEAMTSEVDSHLDAGPFASWLAKLQGALAGDGASDVPCNGCTACCTSSQFVHIGPDETDTLAHIPPELVFPAPRMPAGHVVLGYDDRGHCPMLIDGACSIYEHRPRTCRTYDCRVFPASGVEVDKPLIAERTRRWRFQLLTDDDRAQHAAVRAAAALLRAHVELLPADTRPANPTELAVLAVRYVGEPLQD